MAVGEEGQGKYPCAGSDVKVMPMDKGSDERHHIYECPEAGDAAIESHGGQSIVLHDA